MYLGGVAGTFSNWEFVTAGLVELEIWCGQSTKAYAGSAMDELKHLRQVVEFLRLV